MKTNRPAREGKKKTIRSVRDFKRRYLPATLRRENAARKSVDALYDKPGTFTDAQVVDLVLRFARKEIIRDRKERGGVKAWAQRQGGTFTGHFWFEHSGFDAEGLAKKAAAENSHRWHDSPLYEAVPVTITETTTRRKKK